MVKVKANSIDSLRDIITDRIRRTKGVSTLLTLMLAENQPTQSQTKLTEAPISV